MPQKKRLERKLDPTLETRKFYKKRFFVFVLDLQVFYETGAILKVIMPAGNMRYIPLKTSIKAFNCYRSIGVGVIEGNTFSWIDFCPNSSLSLCISWLFTFTRYIRVSLFLFCFLLYFEVKKEVKPKVFFGLFIYYLIYSFDLAGWSLGIHKPLPILCKENEHFLIVCVTTINDLPQVNTVEFEKVFRDRNTYLTNEQETFLTDLKELNEDNVLLIRKIKMVYWVLQQAGLKNMSNHFSIQTWASCADLLLYYAQSLRLWIP